jgi:hypothetical protein
MPYTPAYPNTFFAKPLLAQIVAVIQRDQASAIAIVNPQLAPVSEFHFGPGLRTAFPWMTLSASGVSFDEDAFPYTRSSTVRIMLGLDVGQFDTELAQSNAQDYARILDMVVTTATTADWVTSLPITQETVPSGMTRPGAVGSVKEVFVLQHQYSLALAQEIQTPVLRVNLALKFRLEEN